MSIEIRGLSIDSIRFETIGELGQTAGSVIEELARGNTPEALIDRGDAVSETDIAVAGSDLETTPEEASERIEQRANKMADAEELREARALDRKANLERVLERAEEYGNRRGHLRSADNPPASRIPIQVRQKRARGEATESLKLACGVCRFAGRCGLKDNFDKWFETKPYKDKSKIPKYFRPQVKTETRDEFRKQLADDPEAHCNPASATRKTTRKKAA